MELLQELKKHKKDIVFPDKNIPRNFSIHDVIWDNYYKLTEYLDELYDSDDIEELFFYTIIYEGEDYFLVRGCSYAERIGYILAKKDIFDFENNKIEIIF